MVAKVGIFQGTSEDKVSFASYLVRMRTNENAIPDYMNYLLNSKDVLSFARQQAIPSLHQANLNPTRYGRIMVPMPPKEEQLSLLSVLDEECLKINSAISRTEREIQLMQEYRTRLISDVVTGKIDVRDILIEDIEVSEDIELDDTLLDEEDAEALEDEKELACAVD